jgi:hypothetical protein
MSEFLIYQSENGRTKLDVRLEDETVWLSQKQLTELFGKAKGTISEHIKHIFEDGELDREATVRFYRTVQIEGDREVVREVESYNLDMVLALGFRVRSPMAVRFRQWAADKLKEYIVTFEEIGWVEAAGASIKPGMFIARVRGHSMEPKIKDGSWNLFRPCPQGSREGRTVLVQFNSRGDLENGGRFTVKKYQSVKRVSEDDWNHEHIELLPLNSDNEPISIAPNEGPEMVVVGEWVASID